MGSSVRLDEENLRLRAEARRDTKRIQKLENEIRMLTRAAAAVVVAARSVASSAGVSIGSVGSVGSMIGSVGTYVGMSLRTSVGSLEGSSVGSSVE